jgi:hypothetical protein
VIPIELLLPEGMNPTALYSCCKQLIVIVVLHNKSTVTPDTVSMIELDVGSISGVSTSDETMVDMAGLNRPKIVVGWITSIWSWRLLGRL